MKLKTYKPEAKTYPCKCGAIYRFPIALCGRCGFVAEQEKYQSVKRASRKTGVAWQLLKLYG